MFVPVFLLEDRRDLSMFKFSGKQPREGLGLKLWERTIPDRKHKGMGSEAQVERLAFGKNNVSIVTGQKDERMDTRAGSFVSLVAGSRSALMWWFLFFSVKKTELSVERR